ncbi:hypothetical protein GW17_00045852 [Ensete ventricosum]|nr:hypothetical protein GW17_00045852 [Ensete ventricosum]
MGVICIGFIKCFLEQMLVNPIGIASSGPFSLFYARDIVVSEQDKHTQKHSPYKRGGPSWVVWRTASICNRLGEMDIEKKGKESLRGAGVHVWHLEEGPTLCTRGTMRTSKRRRMHSVQRLGWLSSSYGSTLATKLDGAQGKAEHLVKDETM